MKILPTFFFCTILFLFGSSTSFAQQNKAQEKPTKVTIEKNTSGEPLEKSEKLQTLLDAAAKETLADFAGKSVKPEEIAATIIDLSGNDGFKSADYNGEMKIYPASVVKMFYLVAAHQQAQDGKIKFTPEFERGLKDMIEVSSNDATQYVLDVLTDTASGGELPEKQFAEWSYKRNAVNRYYESLGYKNINVNQKTYCEDAYGREQQFRNFKGENRNMLTTNATARLLAEIAARRAVSAERSAQMLELLKRDPFAPRRTTRKIKHTDSREFRSSSWE